MRKLLLYAALWIAMIALRQDPWFQRDSRLVFGMLPAGLAWQGGIALLAAGVMAWLVKHDWPAELEELEDERELERRA